jgi:cold shock CspA family protein
MNKGKIKWFSAKGYGFLISDNTKDEIYFHVSNTEYEPIVTGDLVTYELVNSKHKQGKKEAVKVNYNGKED